MQVLLQYRLIVLTNIAQEWLRLHHFQYRFLKISGHPQTPHSEARLASLSITLFVQLQNVSPGLHMYAQSLIPLSCVFPLIFPFRVCPSILLHISLPSSPSRPSFTINNLRNTKSVTSSTVFSSTVTSSMYLVA